MSISSVDSTSLHVKPAVDLNIAAEANRILYVLNKIINRAKLIGLLEKFIREEKNVLRTVLDTSTYFAVQDVCLGYLNAKFVRKETSSTSISSSNDTGSSSQRGSDGESSREDYDPESSGTSSTLSKSDTKGSGKNDTMLSKVLYLLEDNPKMQALVKTRENDISPSMKIFIKTLEEFVDRMSVQLSENSTQYKNREKYLRETFEKNQRAKKEIERLEEELVVTKTDANVCLIGRNILINRHQNKIEKIQRSSAEAIEKRVHESEKAMVNDWKESLLQQERLKQDYHQASEKYTNMLKDHLAAEKVLRAKKAKIENQVLGWIQKFDLEIGEKQAEEEEVQALLDKETDEVNEIQRQLDEQEEEYDDLMQEKAAYEEEMLERRLYQFVVNRSARSIQRCFRMYKARRMAKKMGKKGKKGKKG